MNCCTRLETNVQRARAEIARIARRLAYLEQRGNDPAKLRSDLEKAQRSLAMAREVLVDHEAEHAA